MIGPVIDELRLAVGTVRLLDETGQLDPASLRAALGLMDERIDEIEVLLGIAPPATVRLPVMTLADIVAEHRAAHPRPALTVHQGGLA